MPAIFTLNVPDAATANRIVDALCAVNGYSDTIDGQPNPETKAAFAKRQVVEFLRATVAGYETATAARPAAPTVT